jgi:hypothetical protein
MKVAVAAAAGRGGGGRRFLFPSPRALRQRLSAAGRQSNHGSYQELIATSEPDFDPTNSTT